MSAAPDTFAAIIVAVAGASSLGSLATVVSTFVKEHLKIKHDENDGTEARVVEITITRRDGNSVTINASRRTNADAIAKIIAEIEEAEDAEPLTTTDEEPAPDS